MNIEEAKRAIRELEAFNYFDFKGNLIKRIDVLGIIDQLGQPKVVVPKPVFEMIKFRKEHDQDLTTTFVNIHAYQTMFSIGWQITVIYLPKHG